MDELLKALTILFLSIYLFSATEVYQLLKIPFMVNHFSEHKTANEKVSFVKFILMHYFDVDENDQDFEKDMKLPFIGHI